MSQFMFRVRRAPAVVAALAVVAVVFAVDPAYGADTAQRSIVIPPIWLPVIAALIVNAATAFATRVNARSWVKAVVALFFVAVAALVQNVMANGGVLDENLFNTFVVTFVLSVVEYVGLVRPARVPEVLAPAAGFA